MNDFTKKELQLILDKFSLLYFSQFEGCEKLTQKIQSMIDSYCEHEPEPSQEICCTKCQRTLL